MNRTPFWKAVGRGMTRRCPACGHGALLQGYLKPVERCERCGEAYGHIRSDDGPAWLTILLVGHILAPVFLAVFPHTSWPDWVSMIFWPGLALLLALMILPFAKGAFLAAIWQSGAPGAER